MESQMPSVSSSEGNKKNMGINSSIPRKNTNVIAAFILSMLWQ